MSDARIDFFGVETRVGDVVVFNRPGKTLLIEGKVAKLTPKGISVEYERWTGHFDHTFVAERQFARKPDPVVRCKGCWYCMRCEHNLTR